MNRNHFVRPLQGNGRDAHGYGNTDLEPADMRTFSRYIGWVICVVGFALTVGWVCEALFRSVGQ